MILASTSNANQMNGNYGRGSRATEASAASFLRHISCRCVTVTSQPTRVTHVTHFA